MLLCVLLFLILILLNFCWEKGGWKFYKLQKKTSHFFVTLKYLKSDSK